MVSSYLKYASTITKTRSLYGKLLSKDDYNEIIEKKDVHDVAAYLKNNTYYGNILVDVNENIVHRGELEKILKTSVQNDYAKLLKFLRGKAKKFLETIFLRYEIEDLKIILRILSTDQPNELEFESLVFLTRYSELDRDKLVLSESVTEFIENLKGTEYYNVLAPFATIKERQKLFDIEMALDIHFFKMVLDAKDRLLSGSDRKIVNDIYGIEIDILNIFWIYRCIKFFDMPKEVILNHVIPHWHNLNRRQLIDLSSCKNMEEFKGIISNTKYRKILKSEEEPMWEKNYMFFLYKLYKKQLYNGDNNFGTVMAYLRLKEMDIKNIITIIEGIRYSLPKEEVKKFVVVHWSEV
ncbi:V-type ATPase subunit [Herbivorax sp. ANBcel31]|uniref:V-type ATPase subunit n=1 Tax=Herbivorax sp. ANBcel31 TaxID=3069754 RepID=UPI0027B4FF3D|nr:V-type ATPase subunit [Herbivorax sp. ANBcel31]MDQ2087258.1 V-type ATPase subunit [Herbivorax sp. ANBcel31]